MDYGIFYSLQTAFMEMWASLIQFLPTIIVAVVVMIVGAVFATSLKSLVKSFFNKLGVDNALNVAGVGEMSQKAGYQLNSGEFMGTLVKWFVLLVFFVVALDILNLNEVTSFLSNVVISYLPNVIIAVLILIVAAILAGMAKKTVMASAQLAGMKNPQLFGKVAYLAIITVAILAALNQLHVASELIQPLFMGIVFAISLALGLAFGLGGKEAASRVIDSVTKK